jgi:CheY-like chemotaxis protein
VRPTILVVEDRVPIRDRLARQFQEAGARVLPAATAEDALRLYKRQAFEIAALVTDIRLEDESEVDISGIELAKQIAEIDAGLPKFGVTAFDPSVGRGVLEKVFSKTIGGSDDPLSIYRHIPEIVGRAVGYEEGRFRDVPKDLLALKE